MGYLSLVDKIGGKTKFKARKKKKKMCIVLNVFHLKILDEFQNKTGLIYSRLINKMRRILCN